MISVNRIWCWEDALSRQTIYDDLLDQLGQRICGGVYAAHEVLRTDDLAAEFDLSRTVIREALKVIESMGLIRARRSLGLVVMPQADWHVFDPRVIRWRMAGPDRMNQLRSLTQLRQTIEPVATRFAALHASDAQRQQIVELADLMMETGEKGDLAAFLAHDIDFHALLLEASGNEMFRAISTSVAAVLKGRTEHKLMPTKPKPESLALHKLVAVSVANGDSATAEAAMQTLMNEVRTTLDGI